MYSISHSYVYAYPLYKHAIAYFDLSEPRYKYQLYTQFYTQFYTFDSNKTNFGF